jgi:DNA invertase Pin-like site-specific DNA recombinase
MKIGIYTRVSTEEQKKTGISLRDQEQRGIEFCVRNGYEYEIFSDGGFSGELDIENRPELNRLVDKLLTKPKEIDGVFVVDIDRLTRDAKLGFLLKQIFIENEIKLFNVDGFEINLHDENEDLMMGIKFLLSSFELKKLRIRIKRALERNVKDGKVMGGPFKPFGYQKGPENKLIIFEEESEIVKRIFQLCIEGNSCRKIADILNEEGVPTKRSKSEKGYLTFNGKKHTKFFWRDAVIHSMLKNPLYKGERRYKGNIYPSPVIINEDKFELVQRILTQRNNFKDTTNKHFYLLKGLIVCPVCGMRFYGRKRVDLSDNQYICCSQRLKNFCGNRGMNIDKMNKVIWDLVINLPNNMKMIMLENKDEYHIKLEKNIQVYKKKLKIKLEEVENILDLFRDNDKGRELVKKRLEKLEKIINGYNYEIKIIERELKMVNTHEDFLNTLKIQLSKFSKNEPDDLTKQKIIRTYIKVIYLKWVPKYKNHLMVVQFELDRFTDLNLQGLVEVKYKVNGWRYDNELVKYGFRAVLPDFDVRIVDGKSITTIREGKIGYGIRIEDDLFEMTRTKSVNEIINTLREEKDPYNDKRYIKNKGEKEGG